MGPVDDLNRVSGGLRVARLLQREDRARLQVGSFPNSDDERLGYAIERFEFASHTRTLSLQPDGGRRRRLSRLLLCMASGSASTGCLEPSAPGTGSCRSGLYAFARPAGPRSRAPCVVATTAAIPWQQRRRGR